MLFKEIQKNETLKFRVPDKVAEQFKLIKIKCKELDWKFELNDEIAKLIEKQCRIAFDEIQAELDRRKKESTSESADTDANTRIAPTKSLLPKPSAPSSKPLPIMIPGKNE
jgi:hypothetical protein